MRSAEKNRRSDTPVKVPNGRYALLGLAAVLVLLSIFALWSAFSTYRATSAVLRATQASSAFGDAHSAVLTEESLERKYRLEPSPEIRSRHAEAGAALRSALAQVKLGGDPSDARVVDEVLSLHGPYLRAIDHMFGAVDAGDTALSLQIDGAEVDPAFEKIEEIVTAAAETHFQAANQQLDRLKNVETSVLLATPIVFAIGIGAVFFFALVLRSYRRQAERALISEAANIRLSELRFRSLVQNASDVVLVCARGGTIIYQTPRAETAWKIAADALVGNQFTSMFKAADQTALRSVFNNVETHAGASDKIEVQMDFDREEWRYCEVVLTNLLHQPGIHGIVATVRDVTERRAFEQELKQRAFYDPLTKLANRALFSDRLEQTLMQDDQHVGLLFIDLDHFKLVNDSLSHQAGDQLLVEAAARLRRCARSSDTVARLGGDEFVILLPNLASEAEGVAVADRVVREFEAPFQIRDRQVIVTASVGVAVGQANSMPSETLLRHADTAMYQAKVGGKARHVLFQASMQVDDLARLKLEEELRRGIAEGELRVHYQPIVALSAMKIEGLEALVRWHHPTRGLLLPATFIPIAEESGLIGSLGIFVLNEACRQVAIWQRDFPERAGLSISVNLSPRQFQDTALVTDVARALETSGLPPESLILEITESVIMSDVEATIGKLWQLRGMGINLAIDDFGTGYSSLAYLKRLPIHILKIDRSFIQGIAENPEDAAIVQAIMTLARSLDLKVTAEGIETPDQAALLEGWAADRAQGYYFARPANASAIELMLASRAPFKELNQAA